MLLVRCSDSIDTPSGFLVQLTTVMAVPVVQAAFSGNFVRDSNVHMAAAACFLAFAEVVIMGLDGKEAALLDVGGKHGGGILSSLSSHHS